MKLPKILSVLSIITLAAVISSCSSFKYKTYQDKPGEDDPEPVYSITLNPNFQDFTDYMYIGNRIENFGTYFNTFFNASSEFDDAYEEYQSKILSSYSEKIENIGMRPPLSQEAMDKFNKAIEKTSRVIQYHKSTKFMDDAVLLIGKSYYFLGDYLKSERKFSEFISKLKTSPLIEEALLYLAKTQLKLNNPKPALERLENLIKTSKDKKIIAESYQTIGEYYITKKDYPSAIDNYKKSIQFSDDKYFKAQIQFFIASVTSLTDSKSASNEFRKVLNWETSYELEYLARFNLAKTLILSNQYNEAEKTLKELIIDYKDNVPYLSDLLVLNGRLYDQKKEFKKGYNEYINVIKNFPRTIASSDASFFIGNYFENVKGDYLNALRFYNYSNEESSQGRNLLLSYRKIKTLKKYFDLRSIITGKEIKTEYDSLFFKLIEKEEPVKQREEQYKGDQGKGGNRFSILTKPNDSIITNTDSLRLIKEKIAKAKFELAELFSYDLNRQDSAQFYFEAAYNESEDPESKSRALFALAIIDQNNNNIKGYEEKLNKVIEDFPYSVIANECRRLLNLPLLYDETDKDAAESLYVYAENQFIQHNYQEALITFIQLNNQYPESKYLDRSYYAVGWIYENILNNSDSSYIYYSKLMELNPSQEIKERISDKVAEYKNWLQTKDSTSTDTTVIDDTTTIKPEIQNEQTPSQNEEIIKEGLQQENDGSKNEGDNSIPFKEPKKEDK